MSHDSDPRLIAARHYRRNFLLGLTNGALFGFIDSLISPYLVMSLFVNSLGGSNFLVGLLPAIYNGGWFLPQFLISHRLQQMPRKKVLYNAISVVRVTCWACLILATFLIGASNPLLLLVVFFVLYTSYSLAGGVAGAAFMDVVAKTIPASRRGTFFGRRDLSGAIFAIGASYLIGVLLNPALAPPFPFNFGIVFLIAGVAIVFGLGAFIFVVEPVEKTTPEHLTFTKQLASAGRIFREDEVYRRYLLTRIAIAAADIATPFYAIYATRVLGVPPEVVGIYLALTTGASLITNPILSRVCDRRGNRVLLVGVAAGMLAMPLIALAFGFAAPGPALGLPFGILFIITGMTRTGGNIVLPSALLNIAPAQERPLYIGFTNTILGVATFLPILGGILLDIAGFRAILLLTAGVAALAGWLASGMVEPRALRSA